MGPFMGGQAEYLRVPYADFNALKLPNDDSHEKDFALLTDIFPTGWDGVTRSGFKPGETIAIFGAGPVGLMADYSAKLRGASKIFSVDRHKERLDKAKSIGAIPINLDEGDPVEQILGETEGEGGVDRGVDAVGYQATVGLSRWKLCTEFRSHVSCEGRKSNWWYWSSWIVCYRRSWSVR